MSAFVCLVEGLLGWESHASMVYCRLRQFLPLKNRKSFAGRVPVISELRESVFVPSLRGERTDSDESSVQRLVLMGVSLCMTALFIGRDVWARQIDVAGKFRKRFNGLLSLRLRSLIQLEIRLRRKAIWLRR
ncbi:hypothetical protein FHS27_004814 [Rhodopirellula rubra]|uniref:Uncharacterized protein n=1 Tax=Aporhodopirellula rubra TaxID=980271 RepID=A0A7W5E2L1_9BACT|nr:hypothetical protein [Aporhodopirellula rubra]